VLAQIPNCTVLYLNTEQLSKTDRFQQVVEYMKKGITILDYSSYHVHLLPSPLHILLPELPPSLSRYVSQPKRYHVGICAILGSTRRQQIYTWLLERGVSVININGWKEERDRVIGQCMILLNIHYSDDYQVFEHLRCDRWLLSGGIVVSEDSLTYHDEYKSFPNLIFSPYGAIVQTILNTLQRITTIQTSTTEYSNEIVDTIETRTRSVQQVVQHLESL
jgi:hypothetical protein